MYRTETPTRFLWVKDTSQPLRQDNIITYRFNRVTFGLICSPFLLAGTIKYHLQHNTRNKEVARDIDNNTYVDNVVMTARSSTEATTLYRESKKIFRDMKMNLREFISNDAIVKRQIAPNDLSNQSSQKILGILWDSSEDTLPRFSGDIWEWETFWNSLYP
uniref:Complex I-B15 n=1 Tax=Haemonchus contortus TaxID=6289 RepID=A0A7I4XSQ8_HAECO